MRRVRHRAVAAVVCLTVLGAPRLGASAAAPPQLVLSPAGGTAGQPFTAAYVEGRACDPRSEIRFQWDATGPVIARVLSGQGSPSICAVTVLLVPPAEGGLSGPGPHVVRAVVVAPGDEGSTAGGQEIGGSAVAAVYTVGAASGAATPVAPPPTPAPTPVPTEEPVASLNATFPPHGCNNGVPDGPTECPAAGGAVALAGPTPGGGDLVAAAVSAGASPGVPTLAVVAIAVLIVGVLVVLVSGLLPRRRRAR